MVDCSRFALIRMSLLFVLVLLDACSHHSTQDPSNKTRTSNTSDSAASHNPANSDFKGKIAKNYQDSEEWWPPEKRPQKNAPNVIIFLLDDTGFAQV